MNRIKNMNDLAKRVTLLEGKKKVLNIADVKEVLRCLGIVMLTNSGSMTVLFEHVIKLHEKAFKRYFK